MRRTKRLELRKLREHQQASREKFNTLSNAFNEYGIGVVRKMRDSMSSAGVHFEKSNPKFSTAVRGKEKRKGSSKQPMGYPSVNSQFGR